MAELAVTLTVDQLRDLISSAVRDELSKRAPTAQQEVLNLAQAAELLDRTPIMVMRYVKTGKLKAHFISAREPRFYRRDIFAYLDSLPTQPEPTDKDERNGH